jgi:peptidoglycan/xylan/chitin deacetylase (PgdA/CDA1 family)
MIGTRIEEVFRKWIYYLHGPALTHILYRRRVAVLMYHGFTDKDRHEGIENDEGKHLHVERFREQMEYLRRYHNPISLVQLIDYYCNHGAIPDNAVIITMDDGYKSNYELAYPVLRKFGVPATIFLTVDFVDRKHFLWFDRVEYAINMTKIEAAELQIGSDTEQIFLDMQDSDAKMRSSQQVKQKIKSMPQELKEMVVDSLEHRLGCSLRDSNSFPDIYLPMEWQDVLEIVRSDIISFGSHTVTHVIMTKCSVEAAKREASFSKQYIEDKTGLECKFFCYPNGKAGDFDHRTRKLLKEIGYSCALTSVQGFNDEFSDVFELKRIGVGDKEDMAEFTLKVSGVNKLLADIDYFLFKKVLKMKYERLRHFGVVRYSVISYALFFPVVFLLFVRSVWQSKMAS